MELTQLFNTVEEYACNSRVKDPKFDGLKGWQPIKETLTAIDNKFICPFKWKKIPHEQIMIYDELEKLEEHSEVVHFRIQCIRIPLFEKPSIRKLMQIAYNIGQLKGTTGVKIGKIDDYIEYL